MFSICLALSWSTSSNTKSWTLASLPRKGSGWFDLMGVVSMEMCRYRRLWNRPLAWNLWFWRVLQHEISHLELQKCLFLLRISTGSRLKNDEKCPGRPFGSREPPNGGSRSLRWRGGMWKIQGGIFSISSALGESWWHVVSPHTVSCNILPLYGLWQPRGVCHASPCLPQN